MAVLHCVDHLLFRQTKNRFELNSLKIISIWHDNNVTINRLLNCYRATIGI